MQNPRNPSASWILSADMEAALCCFQESLHSSELLVQCFPCSFVASQISTYKPGNWLREDHWEGLAYRGNTLFWLEMSLFRHE